MVNFCPRYFESAAKAAEVAKTIPAYKPSRFLRHSEIEAGLGKPMVREFTCGFAIQLGNHGNYYPATTADCSD